MTQEELLRLLSFYLDCIESEDRRSLKKSLSSLHHSLVSPWEKEEPFFHAGVSEVLFKAEMASDRKLLLGSSEALGGPESFFYGYPSYLDEDGFLMPLFFTEVQVEHRGDGVGFAFRPIEAGEVHVNHHVLHRQHATPEEMRVLQEELEGEFGSFADRLRSAFEAMGFPEQTFPRAPLDLYPRDDSPRNVWVNRPILFKSERSPYTHHLRRELGVLVQYAHLYSRIEETALGLVARMSGQSSSRDTAKGSGVPLLQVLPLNPSQERAARAALKQPLTVVTGPPGTGKSQVVVDLLASCALARRPVLFASKNNKAVNVVRERLREILGEEYDWTLRLGSREVMDKSIEEMFLRLDRVRPGTVPPSPSVQALQKLDDEVSSIQRATAKLEQLQTGLASLEKDRRAAEDIVPPKWVEEWPASVAVPLPDSRRVERFASRLEALAGIRPAGLWLRIARAVMPGFLLRRARAKLALFSGALPGSVQYDIHEIAERQDTNLFGPLAEASRGLAKVVSWRTTEESCKQTQAKLSQCDPADVLAGRLEKLQATKSELSADRLRSGWTARIAGQLGSVRHELETYRETGSRLRRSRGSMFFQVLAQFKRAIQSLGSNMPVWIVTNLSVNNALPFEPELFDLVIIDEASQCDVPSALPLLYRARRTMIIGDPRQLRHISTLLPKEEELLALKHNVGGLLPTWSYNQCSLYALAEGVLIENGQEPFLLAEHYRSHPDIIEFSNRTFYGGSLILRTEIRRLRDRMKGEPVGLFWHDVRGVVPRTMRSSTNEAEVKAVVDLLDAWVRSGFLANQGVDFGIVSPFRLQVDRIEQALRDRPWWEDAKVRVSVGTAHRFQGDECDVIVFSPVVAEGMSQRRIRWVADTDQLLNVAITRARCALHVVGDMLACKAAGGFLGEFATASQESISSRDPASTCESPAEIRVAELLEEIGLWFVPQYRIGQYRIDFLVVTPSGRRWDVEVDGRGHRTDSAILQDEIRDAVVAKAGLAVMRIDARRLFRNEVSIREALRRLV